jgi:hypothetical protein
MHCTATVEAGAVHDLPVILDQQRILADQVVSEFMDGCLYRQRAAFDHRFAPANDALVRLDLQETPARRNDVGGKLGNLHVMPSCRTQTGLR